MVGVIGGAERVRHGVGWPTSGSEATITWAKKNENDAQGADITNWRRQFHVMDHDPF
ncbi:hypothetical protein ABZT08_21960 [Streptomyces sp. NPDC005526]|uniref:hypothetical protein n=1 Tax=Streptomyces sp. NPDC005526 TaxID=3156885 RepID=UPI00339F2963